MNSSSVDAHYRQVGLTDRIRREFVSAGYDVERLQPDDLAGVDEFHLGGRAATDALVAGLSLTRETRVLDVGCGIGGAARTIAKMAGCAVTGVDLTAEFVATAEELSAMVGMADTTTFRLGNALDLPFDGRDFDVVTMLHVGMNIEDKEALMVELARVTAPGGTVVVYDIMRVGEGEVSFPVPWASGTSTSFLAGPDDYGRAAVAAGLMPSPSVDRLALASEALRVAAENPLAVNLSHLMGENWPTMFANLRSALAAGVVSPTEIRLHKSAT